MNNQTHLISKVLEQLASLKPQIPEAINSFSNLSKEALKTGMIDGRTKELIALAIAITINSQSCVQFHLESLSKKSLSQEELIEIVAICTYMGGGPAVTTALQAVEIFASLNQTDQAPDQRTGAKKN